MSRGRSGLLRWVEPWYGAYALVGTIILGVAPIMIPLTVEKGGAGTVGLVVAFFYIGALFTPVAGAYADRTGSQRLIFLACFPLMAVSIVLFALSQAAWQWALSAMVFGGAGAIAGTIGGMFVVEAHPKTEWNNRISWFRLAYGAGQVLGLIIAAVAATHLRWGWFASAVLISLGLLVGRLGLPHLHANRLRGAPRALPPTASARPIQGISWVLHAYHRVDWRSLGAVLRSQFGVFIAAWLLAMIGIQTFFNVVPLVMRDAFKVQPSVSSIGFMVGAAVGTVLYPVLGKLATRIGPALVLVLGLSLSIAAFGGMALLTRIDVGWQGTASMVALVVAAVAYAPEVVAATMLVARLSPFSEGSAMGMLNSAIGVGAIIGALAPAAVAARFGYPSLPLMAALVLLAALLVTLSLVRASRTAASGGGDRRRAP